MKGFYKFSISALVAVAVGLLLSAAPARAGFSISGDFEGWTGTGVAMTETFSGSGIWTVNLSMSVGRHEFKVTDGSWANSWPGSGNSWLYTDGSGNVTLTYNTNTPGDGWSPASGRIGSSIDPGTWTAVGDWQNQAAGGGDWNNANAGTAMTSLGGGIYKFQATLTPGTYAYKAVDTGSWDAIGNDNRSVNADNMSFTTTVGSPTAVFYVDALNGAIKVNLIPEPSTIALVGFGLLGALVLRRKA